MRTSAEVPRRRRRPSSRAWLVVVGAVVFFGLTSLRGIAGFYTTYLWFGELDLTGVWAGVLGSKIVLAAIFTGVFFAALLANLVIADRVAPRFRSLGPEDELVQRYRQVVGPHAAKVRLGVAALFALLAGTGASSQWHNWLLFRNSVDFGVEDPQFGRDIGFFVFRLPFLSFLVEWAFVAVVIIAVVTVVAHYLNGGIRVQAPVQRVTPQVKAHVSVLLAVLALIKAVGYYLQRFELSFSSRGVVDGASYTDVKAQLPALELLVIISLFAVVMFLLNIRRKGWALPVIGVGLWALISVIVGAVYPAFTQKFRVEPAEIDRERPYIARNIAATRTAFGIDDVEETPFDYDEQLTSAGLAENAETIRNVRLWDPQFVATTFQKLQEIRSYYRFSDVDIDRYMVDGRLTQTIVSARELNPTDLPSQSWVNRHLSYTHGFGALVAPANAVTADGQPAFTLKDIPPEGTPGLTQPRIYYGEETGGYAIVKSKQREIDYQELEGTTAFSTYAGTGGVPLSSFVRRAAFALRFADFNMLISDLVTPESRAIFIRDIGNRVRTAAPFLRYDADPYPAIVDGRLLWIQDAYTTTGRYPYAQRASIDRIPGESGLRSNFNYVRNSVKVVTDAFNGSMIFYVVDDEDPILKAYAKAFPDLFTPGSEVTEELRAHFRYPEDLFRVQTNMYGRYHIESPNEFYNAGDAWDISQDPGSGSPTRATQTTAPATTSTTAVTGLVATDREQRMDPTYLLLRLPNDTDESFLILQPFVPRSRGDRQQNLSAFMTAKSDPDEYGKLQVFVMPRGEQIDGPSLVDARAAADPVISQQITFLNQQGSEVKLGNVQVIPIENSLLYVRPLYVQSARNPLPEFKRAIVVFGDRAVIGNTLREALTSLFGDAPGTLEQAPGGPAPGPTQPGPTEPGPTQPGTPTVPESPEVQRLLSEAATAYDAAQAALRAGDLAEYQRQIGIVGEHVKAAQGQATGPPAPTTTTTTAPTA
ncbi:MAG TPA: UPF0182 family protein [Acidimicrobiales bacterium]|jgi:uncharacterized protein|nr:UPF0182 family protein [Acidimicrobiales bacterium]